VSVIAWSQGNLDTQWALKYWPSTRSKVSDFIAMSADFHGALAADIICPTGAPCAPSFKQQEYNSNFITALRSNGGDSAYVPTTSVYSATDEVVQPQAGTNASAYILDARHVGVSNTEVQTVCPGQPAGGFVTHEGILYNPLAYSLAVDALKNPGPGSLARIKTSQVCPCYVAPGLNLNDFLLTESKLKSPLCTPNLCSHFLLSDALITSIMTNLAYEPKVTVEPPLKSYAR
jgi:hypothetical protein